MDGRPLRPSVMSSAHFQRTNWRDPLTRAARFLHPFLSGRYTATTYFPVRMGEEGEGAVIRLTVHSVKSGAGEGDTIAVAPWSDLDPCHWSTFSACFGSLDPRTIPLIEELPTGVRYLYEFAPLDSAGFYRVDFVGTSFGFAALLALLAAARQTELRTVVSTGQLLRAGPGAVDALRQKAWAIREAHRFGHLRVEGPVPFFCPTGELYRGDNSDNPYEPCEHGHDPSPVDAQAINTFCEQPRFYGGSLVSHVDFVPVASWDEFAREHLHDLFSDPFAEYHEELTELRRIRSAINRPDLNAPHAIDLNNERCHLLVSDSGEAEPLTLALRAVALAPRDPNAPVLDHPVPVFLDLSECTEPPTGTHTDPTDWIRKGVIHTHSVHHLPDVDSDGVFPNRVSGRSRLFLIVFSARNAALPYRFQQEDARVRTVLRYAGAPYRLPVTFVGSNSSHAELIRQIISE